MVAPKRPSFNIHIPEGFHYEQVLDLPIVRAYLKGFSKESSRWNELIESTLSYGIHCLSTNFALQHLNVNAIQDITSTLSAILANSL